MRKEELSFVCVMAGLGGAYLYFLFKIGAISFAPGLGLEMPIVRRLYVISALALSVALFVMVYQWRTKKDILADNPNDSELVRRAKGYGRVFVEVGGAFVRAIGSHRYW